MPPTASRAWLVVYYQAGDPSNEILVPLTGRLYYLKVLVPSNQLGSHTTTADWAGRIVTLLKHENSHIRCTIYKRYVDFYTGAPIGWWDELLETTAEWDGLPPDNGYYTFYSTTSAGRLYHGAEYYHAMEFFDGPATAEPPRLTIRTSSFLVEPPDRMEPRAYSYSLGETRFTTEVDQFAKWSSWAICFFEEGCDPGAVFQPPTKGPLITQPYAVYIPVHHLDPFSHPPHDYDPARRLLKDCLAYCTLTFFKCDAEGNPRGVPRTLYAFWNQTFSDGHFKFMGLERFYTPFEPDSYFIHCKFYKDQTDPGTVDATYTTGIFQIE
ncbi:hypothetical protein F5Y10DRAFT_267477 [Nemania abortiva]|nr:hypothetical protein F5Y10DRAFT_267477 [Nemania abortiva]